ncbi:MAG: signal peptidase I [Clostridia bacterium]|nr:signal peptidase I [Clostridia bacterium]
MDLENNSSDVKKGKFKVLREILDWAVTIVIALVIAMLIKAFLFIPIEVKMVSMQDTLFEGQRLIVYKLGYYFSQPKRGDIIIFEHQPGSLKGLLKYLPIPNPQEVDYIKRVIAVPGDEIEIKDGAVYLNGKKLDEPYAKGVTYNFNTDKPIKIPENKIFVMGDNREHSSDSRQFGPIDIDKVRGKAVFRIWPLQEFGGIYR